MGNHHDAGFQRFGEYGFHRAGVDGANADGIHTLGDQVLYGLNLGGDVLGYGAGLKGVQTGILGKLFGALVAAYPPGGGAVLRYQRQLPLRRRLVGLEIGRIPQLFSAAACHHAHQQAHYHQETNDSLSHVSSLLFHVLYWPLCLSIATLYSKHA